MKSSLLATAALALVPTLLPAADAASPGSTRLLRHPTYHNGRVVFSHLGDLWIARDDGSDVRRLTDHQARDVYPKFSPDGKSIAFSSGRAGNLDVHVVPAAGGKPRQLTFHTADDTVVGWTPDGKRILFASTRSKGAFPSVGTLFEVPVDGGPEVSLPSDWGSWASYSPDGSKLAFTRHPGNWTRQHYRGSYATDLWLMDVPSRQFTRLGDPAFKGNSLWPMFGRNGEIYFVADQLPGEQEKGVKFGGPEVMKSVYNLWKLSATGGPPVQITHHTSGNLAFPSLSADGRTLVYEENFGLWKLDVATGSTTEIPLHIVSDTKNNDVEWRTISSEAEGFSLSPSGKRAAIATHGEIFSIATDRGEVQRVTETAWREGNPEWSPDGKRIAFISDRTGREEIWIADERGRNLKQLTDVACDKSAMTWAADSKSLLWTGSDHKLRRVYLADGRSEELVSSDIGNIGSPQFSPDGKWISYSKPDSRLRSHVYVKPLAGGEERRVEGEDFLMSSGARWTPDGKRLLILGGVGTPGIASLGRTVMQLYSVPLTRIEKDPDDRDVDSEEQAQSAAPSTAGLRRGPGGGPGTARAEGGDDSETSRRSTNATATARATVKIEWDGLERRIKKLTSVAGSVSTVVPSPDGRTYAFIASGAEDSDGGFGGPALYTIADDGSRLTRVSQNVATESTGDAPRGRGAGGGGLGDPQWSRDGRTLYYLQGGGIYAASVSGGGAPDTTAAASAPSTGGRGFRGSALAAAASAASSTGSSTPRRVTFTVRMEIDEAAERRQVFEEAWRVMKNRFYDAGMHGVDWAAARRKYAPLLEYVTDSDELHTVIMQMIGELNASHTGVSGGGRSDGSERAVTRYPGFDLEPDASGYYKVTHIYRKGPADHDFVRLTNGNFILAVNGRPLKTTDNLWQRLNAIHGRKFEFSVNSKPVTEGAWTLSLEPVSSTAQANYDYERWVDSRRELTTKLSQGRVGYLHIRAMDAASLRRFQRELLDNLDKPALIIDQRFNGGGGIDQELLEILNQRTRYQTSRGRDSVTVPRPVQSFYGSMVVLQNERSASDAEMFPDGFRRLGLGKIIGVPTMGAVIGTGSYRLLDGSSLRTPGYGVFTASGENLENYGVPPDVHVDNTPADFLAGRDRQIEKAVEVLLAPAK